MESAGSFASASEHSPLAKILKGAVDQRWREQSSHSAICRAFISVVCALTSFAETLDLGKQWRLCRSFSTRAILPRVDDREPRGHDRLHAGDCFAILIYRSANIRHINISWVPITVADFFFGTVLLFSVQRYHSQTTRVHTCKAGHCHTDSMDVQMSASHSQYCTSSPITIALTSWPTDSRLDELYYDECCFNDRRFTGRRVKIQPSTLW